MLCSTVAEVSRLPATALMAFRTACFTAAHSLVRSLGHTQAHCPTVPRFSTSPAKFPGAALCKLTLSSARTDLRKCTEPSAAAIQLSAAPFPSQALSHCSELAWLLRFAERNYSRENPRRRCDGARGNCHFLR